MKLKARRKIMPKRSGDKARSNKDREKKTRRRLRNQELRKATENKTVGREALDPDRDGNRIVSSQLRRVTRDSKDGSDQGEDVLEIVVYRTRGNTRSLAKRDRKKKDEENRARQEKARRANKAPFRP
jgi:hypothetical protein